MQTSQQTLFLKPLDILILRANKLFGAAGSFGETQIVPWPSVAAGALRSRLFSEGVSAADLQKPETFTLTGLTLARQLANGAPETLHPIPADVVVQKDASTGAISIHTLKPQTLHSKLASSAALSQVPVLAETTRSKAASGYLFNQAGWQAYLASTPLNAKDHLVESKDLYKLDNRIGIGLNAETRSVAEGKLFTTQAVAFKENVGFIARFNSPHTIHGGLLRFGGDGRAVSVLLPSPASGRGVGGEGVTDCTAIAQAKRFKLILATPGLFKNGWYPEIANATLVCAAVPRAEVISGWDLHTKKPKAAQRVAPTGSVYWFETTAEFGNISESALESECLDNSRKAEGFNRCEIAYWSA